MDLPFCMLIFTSNLFACEEGFNSQTSAIFTYEYQKFDNNYMHTGYLDHDHDKDNILFTNHKRLLFNILSSWEIGSIIGAWNSLQWLSLTPGSGKGVGNHKGIGWSPLATFFPIAWWDKQNITEDKVTCLVELLLLKEPMNFQFLGVIKFHLTWLDLIHTLYNRVAHYFF